MAGVSRERVSLGWLMGVAFALFAVVAGGCDGSSGGSAGGGASGSVSAEPSGGGSEPWESESSDGAESSSAGGDARAGTTDPAIADPTRVLVRVLDRSGMFADGQRPKLYLASSASGWDPAWLASDGGWSERAPSEDGRAGQEAGGGWSFFLPSETVRRDGFSFKFTRGEWDTVEVDSAGRDVPNRTLDESEWASLRRVAGDGEGVAVLDLVLEGFADQRGTRWPMDPDTPEAGGQERASTVVGTLELHALETPTLATATRTIRVWLPAGYHDPANADRRYPVLYMHDGQNLFDAATSAFGSEWRVDETMTALIEAGRIEPWIVVGIDHAGEHRVGELSPDGLFVRGQMGSGSRYVGFVVDELVPFIEREYRAIPEPAQRAMGGSSCGGNITVQTVLERAGVFERVLIESPALWIGDEVLTHRAKRFEGAMPTRVFIGMGDAEYGDAERDASLVGMARSLRDAMKRPMPSGGERALGTAGYPFVALQIAEGAKHNEDAWAGRLPGALVLLLGER